MNATSRCEAHKVELLACFLGVAVSLNDFLVLENRTVLASTVNLNEVLINDAAGADVQVAYLRVTHLSFRQTNILATCEELRVS